MAREKSPFSPFTYITSDFLCFFFVFFSEFCMCELASFDAAARGKAELHLEVCPLAVSAVVARLGLLALTWKFDRKIEVAHSLKKN